MRRLLIGFLLTLCAASAFPRTTSSSKPRVAKWMAAAAETDLIAALRQAGIVIEQLQSVRQPFFTPRANVYRVGDELVQIYEYVSAEAAEQEAASVSRTGSSVGVTMIHWVATPHFFRKDRLIVLHVGKDPKVLAVLRELLGPQFAGQ